MTRSAMAFIVGLTAFGLAAPAFAQDGPTYAVSSCAALCKLWRSVSGGSPAAPPGVAPAPYVMTIPPEEVEPPVPSRIVARRGVVMAETPAERAARQRQYAAMLKSIVPAAGRSPAPQGQTPVTVPH